jgi:exopolysaccharide biosynthesis polyprenyl glycosylphosphotransferase
MSRTRRTTDFAIPFLTVLSDAAAIEGAFLLAYVLRFHTSILDTLGFPREDMPGIAAYLQGSLFVVAAWLLLFNSRRMYAARRNVVLTDELVHVVKVVTLGMLIVMSAGFLYRGFSYSRAVVGLLWVFSILLVTAGRASVLALERASYRRGRNLQPAVIIGSDSLANQVYTRLHLHASFGFTIIGYFAERPATAEIELGHAPHLGTLAAAPAFFQDQNIQKVFIALRSQDHPALFDLITACEGLNIEFMMVPDVLELMTSQVRVRELEGIPFMRIKGIPLTAWGRIAKRAFDIAVSASLLLVASPLLLLVALLIKIDSRGSVFFGQRRVGLDGKEFTMHKFRTMVEGAEQMDRTAGVGVRTDPARGIGARNDPRRTTVGRFLRATSLDELPQLLDVLVGEMSLVGPRPERPHFVRELQEVVPKYLDRHRVKTGVTGWAQVNGLRGDTSIAERIKYDLYYVENWSLTFDIKILLRTLRVALRTHEEHDR